MDRNTWEELVNRNSEHFAKHDAYEACGSAMAAVVRDLHATLKAIGMQNDWLDGNDPTWWIDL